jgi:hypothetical protein
MHGVKEDDDVTSWDIMCVDTTTESAEIPGISPEDI